MARPSIELAPRLARAIVVLAGIALASSQFSDAAGPGRGQPWSGILVAAAAAAILLLHFAFTARPSVPRPALIRAGLAQAALCLVSGLPLGVTSGLTSLPVAALLLGDLWIPAAVTVAVAAGIDVAQGASGRDVLTLAMMASLGGLLVNGLARLASLVKAVHAARVSWAAAAVSAERLRVAEEIRDSIAGNLGSIRALAETGDAAAVREVAVRSALEARAASAELRSLSLMPEIASARVLLTAAGIAAEIDTGHTEPLGSAGTILATALREAVTEVVRRRRARTCWISTRTVDGRIVLRVADDGVRTADESITALSSLAERVRAADGRFTARLEREGRFTVEAALPAPRREETAPVPTDPEYRAGVTLFVVTLVVFFVQVMAFLPLRWVPYAVPTMAVVCALQLHYGARDASRWGRIGLAVLAVAAFLPLNVFGQDWIGVTGFLIGSLFMALPLPVALPLAAGSAAVAGVITGTYQHSVGAGFDSAFNAVVTGMLIYGLLRLIRLVRELRAADRRLGSAAAVRERLRIARDLHDLLGHNLAAIVLKAELAKRFAQRENGPDPARALAELRELSALAARTLEELGTVLGETDSGSALTLRRELESAVAVLKAAGIETEVDTVELPLSAETGTALGVVLREAVTNVLRHSKAGYCRVALVEKSSGVRLTVENDGVGASVTPPGSGLGNLSVRLAELGGSVRGTAEDGWYVLEATVPLSRA